MSKKSPTKEIKLLTIEEVDFNLPEIEPQTKEQKEKKVKNVLVEETKEKKEKKERRHNRIKR